MSEIKPCKSCGAPVIWLRHEGTGKPAPIDAKFSDAGNVAVDVAGGTYWIVKAGVAGTHTSHFATCPNAAKHRKAS